MKIKTFVVSQLNAPLIYPFRTALGQHDHLENVLFKIRLGNGIEGLGEAAIAPHITGENVATTIRNLHSVGQRIIGRDIGDFQKISALIAPGLSKNRAALAAVEMAILDSLTKSRGMPLRRYFASSPLKGNITTDITIVISSLSETESAVKRFFHQGFRAFKVKIGRDLDLDLKRVLLVRRFAPRSQIYLDANQGYSAKQSIQFLRELKKQGLKPALIEQPVPKKDFDGLIEVARSGLASVCADETVSTVADCRRVIRHRAADVINIKLMKSGFLEGAAIARLAKQHGLRLMMGAMMESNLAITAAAHFASGLGGFDFIDLDPPFFIKGGLAANPYLNRRGVYDLSFVRAGIGIEEDSVKVH